MFLNAVILVLQELLEAVLLISVLAILMRQLKIQGQLLSLPGSWLLAALLPGVAGAWLYAHYMPLVAGWFDYVGQDVVNALIQFGIIVLMLGFAWAMNSSTRENILLSRLRLSLACTAGAVALLTMREGSEIILYLNGVMVQPGDLAPVLLGTLMATGIGLSCGVFLYYGLFSLPRRFSLSCAVLLYALFAGNMGAQIVLLLTQADWLPYTPQLWDSSAFLPESSITGQLLYALIGYDANPALSQLLAYLGVMILIVVSPLFRLALKGGDGQQVDVAQEL